MLFHPIRHQLVVNDQKFMVEEFQELFIATISEAGIQHTTIKNPTTQALVECLHLTLGDQLRVSIFSLHNWHEDVNHQIHACTWEILLQTHQTCLTILANSCLE